MSTRRRPARPGESAPPSENARERILLTAYDLFARHGIRAVGVDRVDTATIPQLERSVAALVRELTRRSRSPASR